MREFKFRVSETMELACTVDGSGPAMIFIHGNNECKEIFDKNVEVLRDYFTCYCIDSRGHGSSSPVNEFHYQDIADDVAALIHDLGLKEVTICGFSDGGIVGLLLAQQMKEVKHLICCGANTTPKGVAAKFYYLMKLEYFFKRDPKIKLMLNEPNITEADLAKITCPTLVLSGEHDLIRLEDTKKIAENIPNSELYIVPGESHGSYIVHSDKLAHLILAWEP